MFKKLHRQLTFFCSVITGAILIALSITCLFLAGKAIEQTGYSAFQKELVSVTASLQSQDYISYQWLGQMQQQHHFTIYLYDKGEELYYNRLQDDNWNALRDHVIAKAGDDCFTMHNGQNIYHREFTYKDKEQGTYYTSVGYLMKDSGQLSFVILYDTLHQSTQIRRLAIGVLCADVVTLALLILFSWLFTGRMVRPLAIAQKKQQQFVAAASHELRSPLTVMMSGLETVEKADSEQTRRHFLSLIREEGLRMQHLISDMLLLANADANRIVLHEESVSPDDLLLGVYEKYESLAASKGIGLQFLLPDAACQNRTMDAERITQVLSILMDNALSYTPHGGRILLLFRQSDTSTSFIVADDGPSIPDAEKEHIFERFYRAESSHTDHAHFGLGLCTAQEIMRAHHGRITVSDPSDCTFLPDTFATTQGVVFIATL